MFYAQYTMNLQVWTGLTIETATMPGALQKMLGFRGLCKTNFPCPGNRPYQMPALHSCHICSG